MRQQGGDRQHPSPRDKQKPRKPQSRKTEPACVGRGGEVVSQKEMKKQVDEGREDAGRRDERVRERERWEAAVAAKTCRHQTQQEDQGGERMRSFSFSCSHSSSYTFRNNPRGGEGGWKFTAMSLFINMWESNG